MLEFPCRSVLRTSAACAALLLALGSARTATAVAPPELPEQRQGSAIEQWNDRNPWRYSTDAIFGLTRGLQDEGFHRGVWIALGFLTVPLDLAILPAAAVGGLYGD